MLSNTCNSTKILALVGSIIILGMIRKGLWEYNPNPAAVSFQYAKNNSQTRIFRNSFISESNTNDTAFCKTILDDPKPCIHGSTEMPCPKTAGGNYMFSVNQQDYYLYTNHFMNLKRGAVFLDIATNDPIFASNTFFFEKCLKWNGICVEANDVYFEPIFRERTCILVPTCISATDGEIVKFNTAGLKGGVVSDHYKFNKTVTKNSFLKLLRCTTVKQILERYGINLVDYLSLDVEGHELDVLHSIDFDKVTINVISVEIGPQLKYIQQFLEDKRYVRHKLNLTYFQRKTFKNYMGTDAIFLHNSVVFGHPL